MARVYYNHLFRDIDVFTNASALIRQFIPIGYNIDDYGVLMNGKLIENNCEFDFYVSTYDEFRIVKLHWN
jgi:hypothetical protein